MSEDLSLERLFGVSSLDELAERVYSQHIDLWSNVIIPAAEMFERRDEIAQAHYGKPADELTPAERKQAIINEVLKRRGVTGSEG